MNISAPQALKEIRKNAAARNLTFKVSNTKAGINQLYKLVERGRFFDLAGRPTSAPVIIDNYSLWAAYEDCCSGYMDTLGKEVSKNFYAYVGQNATIGTPHPVTGRLSMYGDIIAFSTIEKRDQFVAEYSDTNKYAEKCNRKTAREYCQGMTVANFKEWVLDNADSNVDEHYNSYFGVSA